jgi:hypothetical protein
MYKCISLWLIVLTIIMTICVSHENQLATTNGNLATESNITDDALRKVSMDNANLGECALHNEFSLALCVIGFLAPCLSFVCMCVR